MKHFIKTLRKHRIYTAFITAFTILCVSSVWYWYRTSLAANTLLALSLISIGLTTYTAYHALGRRNGLLFQAITMILPFVAEIIGVTTGLLFGNYYYTTTLGYQLFGVPIVILAAWNVLLISAQQLSAKVLRNTKITLPKPSIILVTSLSMVLVDLLVEPVALREGWWVWKGLTHAPLSNYLSWFIVAAISIALYYLFAKDEEANEPHTTLSTLPYGITVFLFIVLRLI